MKRYSWTGLRLIQAGLMVVLSSLLATIGCAESESMRYGVVPTVCDFEGYEYRTVQIGDHVWMAENLRTEYTADGTPLENVYAFANQESHVAVYGRLYEYEAAMLAVPPGWHLPSDEEWSLLEAALGAEVGTAIRTEGGSGFDAIYAGYRSRFGDFESLDRRGSFGSSTLFMSDHRYIRGIVAGETFVNRWGSSIYSALSVRYVKD